MTETIDSARLTLILNELRLPAVKQDWAAFAERVDRESWPAARFLTTLAEHEVAERARRRLAIWSWRNCCRVKPSTVLTSTRC
jgi:DNA replication protein DnaC